MQRSTASLQQHSARMRRFVTVLWAGCGLALKAIAAVLRHASTIQSELDEIF